MILARSLRKMHIFLENHLIHINFGMLYLHFISTFYKFYKTIMIQYKKAFNIIESFLILSSCYEIIYYSDLLLHLPNE